jgi:hypothetical protein
MNAKFINQLMEWEPRTYLQRFDYGKEGNMLKYNKETPDRIYFNEITVPIGILYGDYDHVITP